MTPANGNRRAVLLSSNTTVPFVVDSGAHKTAPALPYSFGLPVRKNSFIFADVTFDAAGGAPGGVKRNHNVTSEPSVESWDNKELDTDWKGGHTERRGRKTMGREKKKRKHKREQKMVEWLYTLYVCVLLCFRIVPLLSRESAVGRSVGAVANGTRDATPNPHPHTECMCISPCCEVHAALLDRGASVWSMERRVGIVLLFVCVSSE